LVSRLGAAASTIRAPSVTTSTISLAEHVRMGMNRMIRRSRELQVPNSKSAETAEAASAACTPKISEAETNQINELIKATVTNGDINALRERRASRDLGDALKHVKLDTPEPTKRVSLEAKAINDLIKQAHSEDTQKVLRERRKSKEIVTQKLEKYREEWDREQNALDPETGEPRFDSMTGGLTEAPYAVEATGTDRIGQRPPAVNDEMRKINERIAEDKRKRRSSKEMAEVEKSRRQSDQKLADAERAAEELALAQSVAMSGAMARGAAKAAAAKAGGKFVTNDEWSTLQEKLSNLEATVSSLRAERSALEEEAETLREDRKVSRSLLTRIADGFGSPYSKRGASSGETNGSGHAQNFVKKMLDGNSDSFVSKVIRSSFSSPSMRRAGSGSAKQRHQAVSRATGVVLEAAG